MTDVTIINAIINLFSLFVGSATAVLLAYFAYKQASLSKNVKELAQNTNHLKDELVAEVRVASVAKGKLQGRDELATEIASTSQERTTA